MSDPEGTGGFSTISKFHFFLKLHVGVPLPTPARVLMWFVSAAASSEMEGLKHSWALYALKQLRQLRFLCAEFRQKTSGQQRRRRHRVPFKLKLRAHK